MQYITINRNTGRKDVGKSAMRKKSAVRDQSGLTHFNSKVKRDMRARAAQ